MHTIEWLNELAQRGLPYGREDSFKLRRGTLLTQRALLGVDIRHLGLEDLLTLALAQGMPARYEADLRRYHPQANMAFFGIEHDGRRRILKVYLECWDAVRQHVRATGSTSPALLNMGIKWDAQGGSHCRADYICHPLLSTVGVLGRIAQLYRPLPAPHAGALHQSLIRQAMRAAPRSSFLYVEVQEGDSARQSYDVNLYKSGLSVRDTRPIIQALGQHFDIPSAELDGLLDDIASHPLGHVSGGCDRQGQEFTTIYHEIAPQPAGLSG